MKREAESIKALRVTEMNKLKAEENDSRNLVSQLKSTRGSTSRTCPESSVRWMP